jgi:hypothetical protein
METGPRAIEAEGLAIGPYSVNPGSVVFRRNFWSAASYETVESWELIHAGIIIRLNPG